MGIIRINELPEANNVTPDDLLIIMDDPSGSAITKKIPIDIFKNNEIYWTLIINSDNTVSAYDLITIDSSQFENNTGIALRIGNSVTSIGGYAFNNCSGFTGDLVIPNSVTSIAHGAFNSCSGFTGDLTIGNSVNTIGDSAFDLCSGFNGNLTIGNSVTSIGSYAFRDCYGFTGDLVIPNSVTNIGERAFQNCSGFTGDLVIPNNVTSIGSYAFYFCSGFNGNLTIGNSVTSIAGYAFNVCSGLTNVNCYAPLSVFSNANEFYSCTFSTFHVRSSDSSWTAGPTTLGGHTFTVIKDLT